MKRQKTITTIAHCLVCREELKIGLPINVSVIVAAGKSFGAAHKRQCNAITMLGPAPRVRRRANG